MLSNMTVHLSHIVCSFILSPEREVCAVECLVFIGFVLFINRYTYVCMFYIRKGKIKEICPALGARSSEVCAGPLILGEFSPQPWATPQGRFCFLHQQVLPFVESSVVPEEQSCQPQSSCRSFKWSFRCPASGHGVL